MRRVVIKPPKETEPSLKDDTPLTNGNGSNLSDGINLLEAIYALFTSREPVGFCTLKKYRNVLNLELNHPWLFRIISVPFIILDWIQSLVVLGALIIVLSLIIFALAKLVGFTDWYENRIESNRFQYAIPKDINVYLK